MKNRTGTAAARVLHGLAALAGVVVVTALAAGPAAAGQDPGIRVGYYGGVDADEPVLAIGAYGRIDIPGPLNIELSADFRRETVNDGDLEAVVIPVRASAVLNLSPVVSPYLLAGAGLDFARLSFGNAFSGYADETATLFEAHAGVGLEISLGPLNFVADVRYSKTAPFSSDHVNDAIGGDYNPSGWYASLAAGIVF